MEEKKPKFGIRYGLMAAGGMILFTFLLYRGGIDVYLGPVAYLGYAIMITLAVLATLAQRKYQGGVLEFSEALKTAFTVFVIALAAQTLFTWALVNFFDPAFKPVLNKAINDRMEAYWKRQGMPDNLLEESMAKQRSGDPFILREMFLGFALSCILHFIISLPIAFIVKKKK